MEMEDKKKVIGKVGKEYKLFTKAHNLQLHLKGETLYQEHSFTIFEVLIGENYYTRRQHEFMGLTKQKLDKNFAFFTLITEETKDIVLKDMIHLQQQEAST